MPARAPDPFQYSVLRVVPRLERGESLNAGVLLFCRTRGYLSARTELNRGRLAALDPNTDPVAIERHLSALELIAGGDAAAGPVAALPASERFHRLVAPASTVVQPSPVHTGLCRDPADTLEHLFARLVA